MKNKVILLVLLISIFWSVNAAELWDIELWDIKYNQDGSASAWDVSADENDVAVWDEMTVTDEKSTLWDMVAPWSEYETKSSDVELNSAETSESDKLVNTTSAESVSVETLPQTGPAENILLLISLLIAWIVFSIKMRRA